jgi:hypothetical protein
VKRNGDKVADVQKARDDGRGARAYHPVSGRRIGEAADQV